MARRWSSRSISGDPTYLEPESTAFAPDGATVYVGLQESNGIAVVDAASGSLTGVYALGAAEHIAGPKDDGWVDFPDMLILSPESDQLAVTPDGRYLVTADEDEGGKLAPEDLVYIRQDNAHYGEVADENRGTVSIAATAF